MPMLSLPPYEARVLFMGANGGGKTVLARAMLGNGSRYTRGVIIDYKGGFRPMMPVHVITSPTDMRWRWYARTDGWIHYKPSEDYQNPSATAYILRHLYQRGQKQFSVKRGAQRPFIVYVDETLYMVKLGNAVARRLAMLAVSSREHGVGLWCASQRPTWIPVEVRSEAWRWYVFPLGYESDALEVSKYTRGRVTVEELNAEAEDEFSFLEIKRANRSGARLVVTRFPRLSPDLVPHMGVRT